MKKKVISILTATTLAISVCGGLCACGDDNKEYEKISEEEWRAAITATLNAQNVRVEVENSEDVKGEGDYYIDSYVATHKYLYLLDIANDISFEDRVITYNGSDSYKGDGEEKITKYTETESKYSQYVQSPIDLQETTIVSMYIYNTDLEYRQNENTGEIYQLGVSSESGLGESKKLQKERYNEKLVYLYYDEFFDANGDSVYLIDSYNRFEFNIKTGEYTADFQMDTEEQKFDMHAVICFDGGYVSEYKVSSSGTWKNEGTSKYSEKVKLSGYGTTDVQSLLPEAQKQNILDSVALNVQKIENNIGS